MQITQKGQVTIPVEVRERHGFLPNTSIEFKEEDDKVYIVKSAVSLARENPFDYVRGKADSGLSTEEIMKLTRSED
ncbi:MAG: AbrB/MazE/SpoVT family DNA-binding domain-containing protein [Spirochaetaceae bacterium]|nr:AbrB/MazE/SpoVT family DNA-binding domain-containing protein [Spirochaetaceae bacterium]